MKTNFFIYITISLIYINLIYINSKEENSNELNTSVINNECPIDRQIDNGNENDCFSYSNSKYKCCILKNLLPENKDQEIRTNFCRSFKTNSLRDIYYLNGYNYKVICEDDLKKNNMLDNFSISIDESHIRTCGIGKPVVNTDCLSYSDDEGSCCFFTYSSAAKCTKLSKRYKGKIFYGNLYLDCKRNYIKINFLFILFLFYFII